MPKIQCSKSKDQNPMFKIPKQETATMQFPEKLRNVQSQS